MSGREGIAQSLVWGYVLLEELLHKQMLLCAVGHPQRKEGIQETQGKKVSPSLLFIFFFFLFLFSWCSVCAQRCFKGVGGCQSHFAVGAAEPQLVCRVTHW